MLRSFQYDGQWNIVYYPKKPSGFSVFIIGDHHHYVDNQDSFWLHHPGRMQVLEEFKNQGYTGFSSNLYGGHWGSEKAVFLARSLYFIIMKSEILNEKIHIFAEGKGALIALKLLDELQGLVRSVVFLNPCLSFQDSWEKERERKVYYKPFMKEVSEAHDTTIERIELNNRNKTNIFINLSVPIKIVHVMGDSDSQNSALYKKLHYYNKEETEIVYLLPEKRYKVAAETIRLFKKHENVL